MINYRPEIDGMRFIAITVVLFFHLSFSDWAGGFTGVDIFFVLSGYLICGQIYVALSENKFSVSMFFLQRIRRLSTAAFVCFFTTGIAGYVFFSPFETEMLVRNLLGSIAFINNILLMNEVGYFATTADTNPFLHTWSLSIEEQFYIALPVAIILLKYNLQSFVVLLITAFLFSLGMSLLLGDLIYSQEQRYFSSLLRVWELALGGLTFIILQKRDGQPFILTGAPLVGVIAMIAPTFFLNESVLHPGSWALVATLGTSLMLLSGFSSHSFTSRVLASRVPRYLGRISYGTYLWHWPIIVFYQYLGGDLNDKTRVLVVLISFGMGAVSYHFIEQPVRRISIITGRKFLINIFFVQTVVLTTVVGALWMRGENVDPQEYAKFSRIKDNSAIGNENWDKCWFKVSDNSPCSFGQESSDTRPVLLWGDSMANSAAFALAKLADERTTAATLYTLPNCPPLMNMVRDMDGAAGCLEMNTYVIKLLASAKPTDILLFARWPQYGEGVRSNMWGAPNMVNFLDGNLKRIEIETLSAFQQGMNALLKNIGPSHRVIIIGAPPEFPYSVPDESIKSIRFGLPPTLLPKVEFERRSSRTSSVLREITELNGALYLDLADLFCNETECQLLDNGLPIYADHVHFTRQGNNILLEKLRPALE
ncbi:acyltransferase [Amylibacter sp.]|nr:acyltransferase [Amylibacter sp.]